MPETTPTPGDIERAEQLKNEGNVFWMSHADSSKKVAAEQKSAEVKKKTLPNAAVNGLKCVLVACVVFLYNWLFYRSHILQLSHIFSCCYVMQEYNTQQNKKVICLFFFFNISSIFHATCQKSGVLESLKFTRMNFQISVFSFGIHRKK